MSTYKNHAFYTHQPFFIEILKNTSGDILEAGCGDGSTLMIREQIKNTSRKLVSLESNLEWLNKYTHLSNDNHSLYHVDADNNDCVETGARWVNCIEKNKFTSFEIVFIDSSPWLSRKALFEYFKNKARIIIIHDFDYFPNNGIIGKTVTTETYNSYKKISCELNEIANYKLFYPPYKYFAGSTGPPTLICSDLMSKVEFDALIQSITDNLGLYYD